MDGRFAWVLNLDAEEELASPRTYAGPRASMIARFPAIVASLGALVREGDVVIGRGDARGLAARAWCPTPWALDQARRAGAVVSPAPTLDALRAANDRALSASLGQSLPGAAYVTTEREALATLDAAPPGTWLCKRAFGFAGRGRRKVHAHAITSDDRAWIAASLRLGGLQIEPYVRRIADYAIHGHLAPSGQVVYGDLTIAAYESGAWKESRIATDADVSAPDRQAIVSVAGRAARALGGVGYFGPFNVDAYTYEADDGTPRLNPCSEINARYSMGWAVGMRGARF